MSAEVLPRAALANEGAEGAEEVPEQGKGAAPHCVCRITKPICFSNGQLAAVCVMRTS